LRVALVGCGGIGAVRAAAIARSREVTLAVACDIDPARARALAARQGAAAACETDWRAAVARGDVDLVVVSTANDLHAPVAIAAADAGKHVLCEKPMARTPDECRAMIAAAERSGVALKVGFNHRYYGAVLAIRAAIDAGAIGEVRFVRAAIGHGGGPGFTQSWVTRHAVSGGGTLIDNGIHILDLARYLLESQGGRIVEAQGYTINARWPVEPCEDNAFCLFRTDGDPARVAEVTSGWTEWKGYRWFVEAYGTRGYVHAAYSPMRAVIGTVGEAGGRARKRALTFPLFQVRERLRGHAWTTAETFRREFADLAAAIRDGRRPFADGYDGLRASEMADAVYRSAREGRAVRVTSDE
jgi:predicted dehydrogenase